MQKSISPSSLQRFVSICMYRCQQMPVPLRIERGGSMNATAGAFKQNTDQVAGSSRRIVASDPARLLATNGVVSPISSSSRRRPPTSRSRAARYADVSLDTSGVKPREELIDDSPAADTGVRVTPGTPAPGGRVTSARQVGHWNYMIRTIFMMEWGRTSFRHFNSHSSHSSLW